MPKTQSFIVKDTTIRSFTQNGFDYLCITDIARQRNSLEPNVVVGNWMRNRNTIEYLGMWEMLNNPDFNPIEFEGVRSQAGLNAFTLSPSRWIELTNAVGIISTTGRYGGTYDKQNRLIHAQGNEKRQEHFEYDEMGNIWYMVRKDEDGFLDLLFCDHKGNQLVEASDGAGNQNYYNTKEYIDASNADTTMFYDKNGTIIVDMDRNICAIRNNLLNLPDTVQFVNGNQIINSYDAMGRKRSTTYRTLITPTVVPVGSVLTLPSNSFTSRTTYYSGDMELIYGSPGTYWKFYTPVGYSMADDLSDDPHYYYYVHDHLGNVSAVWSAEAGSFVQKTFYYPSGVPMNISTNQAVQPNKYNGKPYEEMHGMDVYEYEFRNYYATIMRFTGIDPLCEQAPWQSPYVYAANNPVCNVDWMGLGAWGFGSAYGGYQMTIIDQNGKVLYHRDDWNDGVYLFEGEEFKEDDLDNYTLSLIGFELPGVKYFKGFPCLYRYLFVGGVGNMYADPYVFSEIYYGNRPATISEIVSWLRELPRSQITSVLGYISGFLSVEMSESIQEILKKGSISISLIGIANDLYDVYKNPNDIDACVDALVQTLSCISAATGQPEMLAIALLLDVSYNVVAPVAVSEQVKISEVITSVNSKDNVIQFCQYYYGY